VCVLEEKNQVLTHSPPQKKNETEQITTAKLQPGPRRTEADAQNNVKSLERKLDERLFLVVKSANGGWDLPVLERKAGEPMVEAAQRAAKTSLKDSSEVYFPSPAPAGYRRGPSGTLDYFYHAVLVKGGEVVPDAVDYAWLTGDELADRLSGGNEDTGMYLRVLTRVI